MRLKMSHLLSVDHSTPPIVQPFASAMFAASTKSDTRIFATGAPMPTVRLPFSQRPSAHVRACRAGLSLHSYVLRSEARRVGQERVSTCRSRWSQYHYTQKIRRPGRYTHCYLPRTESPD